MELTSQIQSYREALRHLWNTYWRFQDPDWDSADNFSEIAKVLFKDAVSVLAELPCPVIPVDQGDSPLSEYRLFTNHAGKLPLMVSRDIPNRGYWDHEVCWISAESAYDICPICFFDFDVLGYRDMRYYRARIISSETHPEVGGRDALIECEHVRIETSSRASGA